jgi:2-keto-4-pentenoate hydratase/2-oxohepta-3-ene-1,7-dioic acid hydratase in catechol pathway
MKIAKCSINGKTVWGLVEGEILRVIQGDLFGSFVVTDEQYALSEVKLLAPVAPTKVIGAGLNYKAVAAAKGVEFPPEPILFLKPLSSITGPGEAIMIPDMVKNPVFEVELAVVIGKQAKNVSREDALNYVFGYTLANDVTAKDHMVKGQPWTKGKSFDTFTPVGPFVVTGLKPDEAEISLTVNGAQKQKSSTSDMIFDVPELIAFISAIMTLEPGDVILTGTPQGGGDFARGDVLGLASPQIGTMENRAL